MYDYMNHFRGKLSTSEPRSPQREADLAARHPQEPAQPAGPPRHRQQATTTGAHIQPMIALSPAASFATAPSPISPPAERRHEPPLLAEQPRRRHQRAADGRSSGAGKSNGSAQVPQALLLSHPLLPPPQPVPPRAALDRHCSRPC